MIRRTPRSTRTDTLFPYTTLFRSQAVDGELGSFAAGIARDIDAVKGAILTRWTTSPVEGQISRVKAIKRQMYGRRSEEHTSELQSLMRISYAVFCLKKKIKKNTQLKIRCRNIIKLQ